MTNRNPILVFFLSLLTCGIYRIYWVVTSKIEMNTAGANIPTAWLLLVPFVNLYWLWCWAQGVEHVTQGQLGAVPAFLLKLLVPFIGDAIIQTYFNKVARS